MSLFCRVVTFYFDSCSMSKITTHKNRSTVPYDESLIWFVLPVSDDRRRTSSSALVYHGFVEVDSDAALSRLEPTYSHRFLLPRDSIDRWKFRYPHFTSIELESFDQWTCKLAIAKLSWMLASIHERESHRSSVHSHTTWCTSFPAKQKCWSQWMQALYLCHCL